MIKRILLAVALVGVAVFAFTTTASAVETKPFDAQAFKKAQAEGKTVLVDFHADWCPTCKAQAPVIDALLTDPKFKEIVVFKVNYDKETALKKELKVTGQSTLIVFKGAKEAGRSSGITDKAEISALFAKGL
jgi:thioredoxin 1